MATTTGDQIAAVGTQPAIGEFVQDAAAPCSATNYIGCNAAVSFDNASGKATGIPIGTVTQANHKATQTSSGCIFVHTNLALTAGARVNIASGEATANAAGTHYVVPAVPADGYAWALVF